MEAMEEPQEGLDGVMEVEEEATEEETGVVADWQEVPKGATDEEKFGATENRAGDLRLVLRRRSQRKKQAQEKGEPRQKFAAFHGRFTRRAVPAVRKGHVRRGPGKRCRRNGVRGPGKTSGSRMEGRSLKQRRPEYVVRGTAEVRTDEKRRRKRPECNSGIRRLSKTSGNGKRGMIVKGDQRPEAKRTHHEAIRKSLFMEITKLIFESSVGIWEPRDELLWKCRPPPKRKR
jgi:hypothetical protein